jgi:hypothetical protein
MTMNRVTTRQDTQNMEYVRRLLRHKQPGFSAALELALMQTDHELSSAELRRDVSAAEGPSDQ